MKFNLKLFVLVGVFVGLRDVWGTEEVKNKDYDGFIVAGLQDNNELKAAANGRRVIKAVYKHIPLVSGAVDIIHENFKDKLSKVLVYDGQAVYEKDIKGCDVNEYGRLYYNMEGGVEYTVYFIFNGGNVDSTKGMFCMCSNLISADFRCFNTENVTDMSHMFNSCTALTELNLSKINTQNVTSMYFMFYNCSSLTKLDLSKFDPKNVTDMSWMFYECIALTELNLSKFNTRNVTNMSGMFYRCTALTKLDLSSFCPQSVTNMSSMFYNCSSLAELNLSKFDTKNVTNMSHMFCGCKALTKLNLSKFDTKNVTNMESMFSGCTDLKNLDLSKFVFSHGCNIADMFTMCNFDNLCIPNTRKRCWCCCGRYVDLKGNVVVKLNQNNVEFEVVHDDLVSDNAPSLV